MVERSPELADNIIAFCHKFVRIPDGPKAGQTFELRDWQQKIIREIYSDPDVRRAIVSFGRKNGKTALIAVLILAHLIGPAAETNSLIVSAAQSRDQAAVVFGFACQMIRFSPKLNKLVTIRESRKELFCGRTGVTYRALSAEASTALMTYTAAVGALAFFGGVLRQRLPAA